MPRANGCADRIEFFDKLSTEITLPEPANIIISDLRGVLPWFEQHIPSIVDARTRLLARGGVLIPHRDILWAALVEAPGQYAEIVAPWQDNKLGLDLSAGTRLITNNWRKAHITPEQFLAQPVCWTTIDYYEVESSDIHARFSWQAARSGTAHGVAVWFDSELVDGVRLSNHPAAPQMIYGVGLFPFSQPVAVAEGERIEFRLAADLVQDGYVWRWETDFLPMSDESVQTVDVLTACLFQWRRLRKSSSSKHVSSSSKILSAKLRKALAQLPYLPRALKLVWEVARPWTIAWIVLLIVQGLLPAAIVYLTKLVVDGVVVTRKRSWPRVTCGCCYYSAACCC